MDAGERRKRERDCRCFMSSPPSPSLFPSPPDRTFCNLIAGGNNARATKRKWIASCGPVPSAAAPHMASVAVGLVSTKKALVFERLHVRMRTHTYSIIRDPCHCMNEVVLDVVTQISSVESKSTEAEA